MPEQQDHMRNSNPTEGPPQNHSRRALSRSPHPYHRQRAELPHARLKPSATFSFTRSPLRSTRSSADESPEDSQATYRGEELTPRSSESDSGTEADDEHFLKGLPAPKRRPHKGLRGGDGVLSGSPSPLVSPAILNEVVGKGSDYLRKGAIPSNCRRENDVRNAAEKFRRKKKAEIWRRLTEIGLLVIVGTITTLNHEVGPVMEKYRSGRHSWASHPNVLLTLSRNYVADCNCWISCYALSITAGSTLGTSQACRTIAICFSPGFL